MTVTEALLGPKFVDATARVFPDMENTKRISKWAKEHIQRVEEVVAAYFDLLQDIITLDTTDKVLREMVPHAISLKEACDNANVPLPQIEDFGGFSGLLTVFKGLHDSREAITAGQDIKRGEVEATPDNVRFAVGTTALDLDEESLGPPIIGHLIERAVYRYLSDRGVNVPDNPKDSILHPQSDILKLRFAKEQSSPLIKVFTHPYLGWSSMGKFLDFASEYKQLSGTA